MISFFGDETFYFKFYSPKFITDLNNNEYMNLELSHPVPYFEYIDPNAKAAAETVSLAQVKGAIIGCFSAKFVMKAFMQASMSFLWGLVNTLQLFMYESMINIKIPATTIAFMKFMNTVTGDVEETDSVVPDILHHYLNETIVFDSQHDFFRENFNEIG